MVAYSFQKRFAPLIQDGRKCQTIRAYGRRRHARVGEALQLFTGMRTRHCKKIIADPICSAVSDISIHVPDGSGTCDFMIDGLRRYLTNDFAQADGFSDAQDFMRFWRKHHGTGLFTGVLIEWCPKC